MPKTDISRCKDRIIRTRRGSRWDRDRGRLHRRPRLKPEGQGVGGRVGSVQGGQATVRTSRRVGPMHRDRRRAAPAARALAERCVFYFTKCKIASQTALYTGSHSRRRNPNFVLVSPTGPALPRVRGWKPGLSSGAAFPSCSRRRVPRGGRLVAHASPAHASPAHASPAAQGKGNAQPLASARPRGQPVRHRVCVLPVCSDLCRKPRHFL